MGRTPTPRESKKPRETSPEPRSGLAIRRKMETPTEGQRRYLEALEASDVTLCEGPAGSGKTYLAIGWAVKELAAGRTETLVISRPIVEAGESLGFLPGDLAEKADPYLAPIWDAIRQHSASDDEAKAIRKSVDVVPLAFMRGRTFRKSIAILDEAQNATAGQIRMFLTRLGEGSRAVIAGDLDQCDIGEPIGLDRAIRVCDHRFRRGVVSIVRLGPADIRRHDLIAEILDRFKKA